MSPTLSGIHKNT